MLFFQEPFLSVLTANKKNFPEISVSSPYKKQRANQMPDYLEKPLSLSLSLSLCVSIYLLQTFDQIAINNFHQTNTSYCHSLSLSLSLILNFEAHSTPCPLTRCLFGGVVGGSYIYFRILILFLFCFIILFYLFY